MTCSLLVCYLYPGNDSLLDGFFSLEHCFQDPLLSNAFCKMCATRVPMWTDSMLIRCKSLHIGQQFTMSVINECPMPFIWWFYIQMCFVKHLHSRVLFTKQWQCRVLFTKQWQCRVLFTKQWQCRVLFTKQWQCGVLFTKQWQYRVLFTKQWQCRVLFTK